MRLTVYISLILVPFTATVALAENSLHLNGDTSGLRNRYEGPTSSDIANSDIDRKAPYLGNNHINVVNYDVQMNFPDMKGAPVEIDEEIEIKSLADLSYIKLHTSRYNNLIGVDDGTHELIYSLLRGSGDEQVLQINLKNRLKRGKKIKLHLVYSTTAYTLSNHNGYQVYNTNNWPYSARNWLISNDAPTDRATFSFDIHVPDGSIAAANGRLDGEDYVYGSGLDENGQRVFHWDQEQPIPTYALNVAVGDHNFKPYVSSMCFDETGEIQLNCDDENALSEIPVVYYGSHGRKPKHIQKSLNAAAFFSERIGSYDFDKIGFVEAPHFSSMESVSLITLTNPDAATHEQAHSWFGNGIQVGWDTFWFSEGGATYLDGVYDEYLTGKNTSCIGTEAPVNPGSVRELDPIYQYTHANYCNAAGAFQALRYELASHAGYSPENSGDLDLFFNVLHELYDHFRLTRLTNQKLVDWMRGPMAEYLSDEYGVSESSTRQWVNEWKSHWLTGVR